MRILVIEDELDLCQLLGGALERAGLAADLVGNLDCATAALAIVNYDVAILDLMLPDGDGVGFLRRLRRDGQNVPVLILTARDGLEDRVKGLDNGADDYMVKPFHMSELISRVRALLRRPNAALGLTLTLGNLEFDTTERTTRVGGKTVLLSPREMSMLEVLLRQQGKVVARENMEHRLYSFDQDCSANAVEVLLHRLRRRLTQAQADVAIHTVRGVGYLMAAGQPR
jgi:DNA-binding response OmpR family regulator